MKQLLLLAGAALIVIPATPALAQDGTPYRVRVGLGAQFQPEYPGADSSDIGPYPTISIAKGDEPFDFGAHDDSFSYELFSSGGFSAGPVASFSPRRKDSDVGAPVGDVDRTVEVGGYLQYYIGESFRLRTEVRKGIGGHEGFVGAVGADYVARDADRYTFAIGPRVRWGDSDYMNSFYGVTPAVAAITPLPAFDADGGIEAVGAIGSFTYSLGGPFGMFGYARYDHLVGDAADSPIVRVHGSESQFSAGLGFSYTFNVKI